jgi:hypothetical protein
VTLAAGTRLGPYEILAAIGAGGMGEVYKARDTRLDRTVAIKILPESLAADPQFRDRFDREARTISKLDHPHICTLYDVGEQDGTSFLVMQYLEGETLETRLKKGPLPLDHALQVAIQIADALAAAHKAAIVHRDLKPGNVMLTKAGAKLLDFGLAKTGAPVLGGLSLSILPTTPPITQQGSILGTFQYMAPEQLEGQDADARTDIFAFGAVVYEMLTGKKAFEGKSQASLIGAIMHAEPPPIAASQPLTPAALDHVAKKCLAKQPEGRWQSASDLSDELKWIADAGSQSGMVPDAVPPMVVRRSSRERIAWITAVFVAFIAALALGMAGYLNRAPADTHTYRSAILPPPAIELLPNGSGTAANQLPNQFALSPDGRRLVFVAIGGDRLQRLWVRRLDALAAQPLTGTEGGAAPFWSPDSRFVAFVAGGKLKKVDVLGGPALPLADVDAGFAPTGAWNRDDVMLFSPTRGPLSRMPASGGSAAAVIALDSGRDEVTHASPFFLPDQRHFLYLALSRAGGAPTTAVYIGSLDGKGEPKRLLEGVSNAMYAQGHVLFIRARTLMAQPFDSDRMELRGDAVPIAEHVETGNGNTPFGAFTVSENDVLAYRAGDVDIRSQLIWFDRAAKQLATVGDPADQMNLELSPDGTRAAVSILDGGRYTRDLWIYDVARGLPTRFTFDPADEMLAVWSPDGSRVAFNSRRKGKLDLYVKASSGAGSEEPLLADPRTNLYPSDWSTDGQHLLYFSGNANSPTNNDIWSLPMSGDRKPTEVVRTAFSELYGRFSPDGRFVTYTSNESGRQEVYVSPSNGPGGKWRISTAGGNFSRWRRDGSEIFFLSPDNKLMAAAVEWRGSTFRVVSVRPLFDVRPRLAAFSGSAGWPYDVSTDGQRFLVNTLVEEAAPSPITLVVNWTAALKK